MEINEIIKPENLVYGKPRLMNVPCTTVPVAATA